MVDDETSSFPDEARAELSRAADALERLTSELRERSDLVERLEVLVDALLDVLPTVVVVVDPDSRIAAVSRGAAAAIPALSDGLGKPASRVLPKAVAAEIAAFAAANGREWAGSEVEARYVALPDGSTLAVIPRV